MSLSPSPRPPPVAGSPLKKMDFAAMPLSKRKQQQKDAREAAAKKQQQQKDDEAGSAAAAPSAARDAPANKPLLGRPPERKDAAPRVRRADDQITCDDAASAGLQKPLGERPHKEPEQLDPEGRKSQAGQKRKQLPEQGQIKQGKGRQRGSLLADCLERAETKCAEVLAGLDQGSSACESTRHDNWIPADWLICCFLFFGQWMGMQLQPNQDQESRAQSRISFAVPLPLQHRHHQRPHQNRRSPPPQALLLP